MSTKAGGTDHLFLFTYVNSFFLEMVLVLIFMIYLFIYSKRCQQNQVEATTFIYLCKSLVVRLGFLFNIYDLFVYFFKGMSTKAGGSDHLFLFTHANHLLLQMVLVFNIHDLFIYLFKAMSTKAGGRDDLYLLLKMTCCETWFSF